MIDVRYTKTHNLQLREFAGEVNVRYAITGDTPFRLAAVPEYQLIAVTRDKRIPVFTRGILEAEIARCAALNPDPPRHLLAYQAALLPRHGSGTRLAVSTLSNVWPFLRRDA